MRKIVKKITVMVLTLTFVFTLVPASHVEAARKPQLKTTKVTLKVGQKKQLKVTNAKKKIKWSSSKKSVAGVSKKGKVTAKKAGKATIYAKVGKRTLKCRVTVVKKEKVTVKIGDRSFTVTLENNSAANALADMLREKSLVIQMSDYSGSEKVGSLGKSLPTSNRQITTHAGDIVLYNGNQIVIFYGSNTWSYTRLGKIDDLSGLEEALGSGDVTVTFSMK